MRGVWKKCGLLIIVGCILFLQTAYGGSDTTNYHHSYDTRTTSNSPTTTTAAATIPEVDLKIVEVPQVVDAPVLLREIQVLTLEKGLNTRARRLPSIPQLECVGGAAQDEKQPSIVQCTNMATYGNVVHWKCDADLGQNYHFGVLDILCEGWNAPHDPYIVRGSCGLKYTLEFNNWYDQLKGYGLQVLKYALRYPSFWVLLGVAVSAFLSLFFSGLSRASRKRHTEIGEEIIIDESHKQKFNEKPIALSEYIKDGDSDDADGEQEEEEEVEEIASTENIQITEVVEQHDKNRKQYPRHVRPNMRKLVGTQPRKVEMGTASQ